jgi:two-component system sensor histidine kinase YesM
MGGIYRLLIELFLFSSAASLAIAAFLSARAYSPVQNVLELVRSKDANATEPAEISRDELGEISSSILRYVYSNERLQKEVKERISMQDKAQIAALQSQINPHFLYNTLETIRWLAMGMTNGDNPVSETVLNLSELLRLSLDSSKNIVSISEELEHAGLYVKILLLRYESKLELKWDVDSALLPCRIVKLSLQPLIENAFYHGIKPLGKKGAIAVSVKRVGTAVEVRVVDDGVGIGKETLDRINRDLGGMGTIPSEHIGLQNVNGRTKLLFGERYGIRAEPGENGCGTAIVLALPDDSHGAA